MVAAETRLTAAEEQAAGTIQGIGVVDATDVEGFPDEHQRRTHQLEAFRLGGPENASARMIHDQNGGLADLEVIYYEPKSDRTE